MASTRSICTKLSHTRHAPTRVYLVAAGTRKIETSSLIPGLQGRAAALKPLIFQQTRPIYLRTRVGDLMWSRSVLRAMATLRCPIPRLYSKNGATEPVRRIPTPNVRAAARASRASRPRECGRPQDRLRLGDGYIALGPMRQVRQHARSRPVKWRALPAPTFVCRGGVAPRRVCASLRDTWPPCAARCRCRRS